VDITALPLFQAKLLVEELRSHGLDALCLESFIEVTSSLTNGRGRVPRGEVAQAEAIIGLRD
jgi:hypothetical protein